MLAHSLPRHLRYALNLTDTVKVTPNASVCLTEGSKDPSDFIFRFEDPDDKPVPSKVNGKAKPTAKLDTDSRPAKVSGVVVGSKVLRGKTRQQLMDPDASKTVSAKIAAHQKDLHAQRQEEGIAKYAAEGGGAGEDNGKAWKRFTSYKGEAALPKESESLRVSVVISNLSSATFLQLRLLDLCRPQSPKRHSTYQWVLRAFPCEHS